MAPSANEEEVKQAEARGVGDTYIGPAIEETEGRDKCVSKSLVYLY